MIESLQEFVGGFPGWLQWVAVALVAMIPFVESYLGTAIGVFAGLNPVVAASAAVVGNITIMLILVFTASAIRSRVRNDAPRPPASPRREKIKRLFERFGVPGVSLLGHPTQISSTAMVGFGAKLGVVILWQVISIVVWAAATGTLASFGLTAFIH